MYLEKPMVFLLAVPAVILMYHFASEPRKNKALIVSRVMLFILLLLALSEPYDVRDSLIEGEPRMLHLVDSTRSMELYPALAFNESIGTVLTGNTTPLGDAVLRLIEREGNIILYTDGNNNEGRNFLDVAALAARLGATLYAVVPQAEKDEVWVDVRGPSMAVVGSEVVHEVVLRKLGGEARYTLEVYVDENLALTREVTQREPEMIVPLRSKFPSVGGHRIKAALLPSSRDYFPENNVYYKSVSVVPKPKILFMTNKPSPLLEALEKNYEVHLKRNENYSDYDAILINDMPLYALQDEVDAFAEYVREGGGLVVIGGENSYNKGGYKNSLLEVYLPVRSIRSELRGEDLALVLALDISGSTGSLFGEYTKADVEKATAIGLIRDLKKEHNLGVIAFNVEPYIIANLSNAHDRSMLEEKIARLRFGGGTTILNAQIKADEMLSPFSGSKNLILLSDGMTNLPQSSLEMAKTMAGRGIKTYTVGVGYDADDEFLSALAALGQGVYFTEGEEDRLRLIFGEDEEEAETFPLKVLDANHFITRGLSLRGAISGLNEVTPKESARVLLTTRNGEAVLAVWRFGLGRVASFATDDGTKWAPELYMGRNSRALSATLNWAAGGGRKKGIKASDAYLGQPIIISSTVSTPLKLGDEPLIFDSIAPGEYRSVYYPEKPGFHVIEGRGIREVVAVNYPLELLKLGFNHELDALVSATGGRTLSKEELQSVEEEARKKASKRVFEREDKTMPFILAAMMLFLAEVAMRRIREVRKRP
jgi:uncharacterized membrane protein